MPTDLFEAAGISTAPKDLFAEAGIQVRQKPTLSLGSWLANAVNPEEMSFAPGTVSELAPAGRAVAQYAPEIGTVAGGVIGNVVPGLGAIPGAALGGGTGAWLKSMVNQESPLATTANTAAGALSGAIGVPVGGAAQAGATGLLRSVSPARTMTAEGEQAAKLAAEYGVPISPSIINPNWMTKTSQVLADKLPVINAITNYYRGKTKDVLVNISNTVKGQYSDEALAALEQQTAEKYGQWLTDIVPETISMDKTIATIKNLYPNMSKNAKRTADTILQEAGLERKEVVDPATGKTTLEWAGDVGEMGLDAVRKLKNQLSTLASKNRDVKQAINKSMIDDLSGVEGGEAAVAALKEADTVYKAQKAAEKVNRLMKSSFPSDGVATINVMPDKFISMYPAIRTELKREAPEVVPALDDMLNLLKAAKGDIAKLNQSESQQQKILNAIYTISGLGGAGASQYLLGAGGIPAAAGLGLGSLATRSLMAPSGWLRQWMTQAPTNEGLVPSLVNMATRAGITNKTQAGNGYE